MNNSVVQVVEVQKISGLTLVGRVVKPTVDPVALAIEEITEHRRKTPYDTKEKWLKYTASDVTFLKAIRQRLASKVRRQYGTSRQLQAIVGVEDGTPTLYIHSEDY